MSKHLNLPWNRVASPRAAHALDRRCAKPVIVVCVYVCVCTRYRALMLYIHYACMPMRSFPLQTWGRLRVFSTPTRPVEQPPTNTTTTTTTTSGTITRCCALLPPHIHSSEERHQVNAIYIFKYTACPQIRRTRDAERVRESEEGTEDRKRSPDPNNQDFGVCGCSGCGSSSER